MPTLRLFANLREAAGTSSIELPGTTVADVLHEAAERFGPRFAAGLETSRVWVNGKPAGAETPVTPGDEVAVIPPVSGGTTAIGGAPPAGTLPAVLVVSLLLAAVGPLGWFTVVAVGVAIAWVWDLLDVAATRRPSVIYPTLVAVTAAGTATYAWGIPGLAGALALAVVVSLTWPVFHVAARDVDGIAAGVTIGALAAAAAGSLVLLRFDSTRQVVAFGVIASSGLAVSWLARRYGASVQSFDPNIGALLGALTAGIGVGLAVTEIDLAVALLGSVAVAAGLVAGRALGGLLRTGVVLHIDAAPGALAAVDGLFVAAPLFWLAAWVFA